MAKRTGDAATKQQLAVQDRFISSSGIVWTVWDTTFSNYRHRRRAHADPTAKQRVFVDAAGVKRSYTFKPKESRVLEPQALERQLGEASYVTAMPDNSGRTPR